MSKAKGELNDFVASFRIPRKLKQKIEDWLKVHPVIGCTSANQYLRKIAIDRFTETEPGKTLLFYANPADDTANPEIAAVRRQLQAAQPRATAG